MFVQATQDYTPDLLQYLKQEPEEQEWATAGPKRDKSKSANALKPLALLDRYCTEGKLLRSHIDDRQGAPDFMILNMLYVAHAVRNCNSQLLCFAEICLQSSWTATSAPCLCLAIVSTMWQHMLLLLCAHCCILFMLAACGVRSACCHLNLSLCRCLSYMSTLHPGIQCQALTEFANHRSKESLSNPPAYFMILLKVSSCCCPTQPQDAARAHTF